MNNKNISVIVPVYNASKYLKECLDSIIYQLDDTDEIIIVNDGSTDDSHTICKMYESEYLNIIYIATTNSGVSAARNLGVKKATKSWICFVDADDKLINGMIEDAKKQIEDDIDAIYYNHIKNTEFLSFTDKVIDVPNELLLNATLNYFAIKNQITHYMTCHSLLFSTCWAKLFRKEKINHYNITFATNLKLSEDTCFCIDYLQNCKKIRICDKCFYWYRLNDNSATQKKSLVHLDNRNDLFDYLQNIKIKDDSIENSILKYIANIILQTNQIVSMINDERAMKTYKELIYRKDVQVALYSISSTLLSDGRIQNVYYKVIRFLLIYKKINIAVFLGKWYRKLKK